MTSDIFKLFKGSIEQVSIKNTDRAAITKPTPTVNVTLDAIVKRRKSMAEAVGTSEDYNNNTTVHFRESDAQYIKIGYYAQVDGEWHSIIDVKNGKDFDSGNKFIYAVLGNDILSDGSDPNWGNPSS